MSDWDELIAESRKLDETASQIQQGETVRFTKEEIDNLSSRYHLWYGKCLSLLPEDLKQKFRTEYDGSWYSARIKKFLADSTKPYKLRPNDKQGKAIWSYWAYPYEKTFAPCILRQRQILIEASERPIQPYHKHDTPPNIKEQSMSKIKVLFLAANPINTGRLSLDKEIREISEKIRASQYRDTLQLESGWAVRPDDLLQLLNEHKPHVVHFSGHGSQAGEIVLADDREVSKSVSTHALKALFTTLKDNIQVIILNACYSRLQAEAITEVIDCVVGMNDAIGDEAAIKFAASFYRAIGFGRSVQAAFDQGKVALLLEGILEDNKPELLMRAGVDPSRLILVHSPTPDAPRFREEQSRQQEEEHRPTTEIEEVRAYIYSQEAEEAIRYGNWEQADTKTRQALHENPKLHLRRELGLSMSNSIGQSFIQEHIREGSSSLQDELFLYRNPSINPMFTPASSEKAIFWLKEAQKQGEDQDGAASAALAEMYGINKKCAAMQEALNKAIDADPEWKERFRRPNSLILLVNGCINEPNIQDTLERLRKDLSLSNPEETFTRYIKERYGKVGYHLYWVIGHPDYWIEHKESIPNFPLDISVSPNKDGDVWQAGASYIVPGNRVYIPKQNEYLPVQELYNQLEKRFFLICPSE